MVTISDKRSVVSPYSQIYVHILTAYLAAFYSLYHCAEYFFVHVWYKNSFGILFLKFLEALFS